jgi:hypothetical protein
MSERARTVTFRLSRRTVERVGDRNYWQERCRLIAVDLWEAEIRTPSGQLIMEPGRMRSAQSLRLALALEIERHGSADEILQGRLIDLVAFVDVDGAPDIPVEAGVE